MKVQYQILIFTMLFLIIGTVGCSSEKNAGKVDSKGKENVDEVITLQFWGGVPPEAGPQAVVDEWNEQNPNVQVEYTRFVNDDDGNLRLNTALQTGQNVDLLMTYTTNHLEDRIQSNFLVDLNEFDGYDVEEKMGDAAQFWKFNDTYYAIPTKQNANFIYLNKDALDQAGLSIPEEWTWQEFKEYAKKLKTDEQWGVITWDADLSTIIDSALLTEGWVKEDGTSNFNHPLVREGFELFYEMMHEDSSIPALGEQIATGIAPDHMFLNGEVAMFSAFEGILRMSNDLEEYPRDFTIAFAPFPHFEGEEKIGHGLGDAISISSTSDYPEEAWEFIKWYADEGMIHQASGGRIPSSKDANIEKAIELMVEGVEDTYDIKSLERMFLPGGKVKETVPLQVTDTLKQESQKFYLGEQSVEKTIEEVEKKHNEQLEK
ncbi:ABC transporter substrate-binding protein [Bacillus sp. SD088]|uniref:ABC transporter substrate-binding protein n=1 Tax=Bacillus sp. SD088 TaxID=2782012 RepID=UPI001A9669DC|nr:extracellular solute-binding protein [Bacillus sp. SD088]MBO0995155.1 extracellular solute-binding protein [Bacillus sp. SD088]